MYNDANQENKVVNLRLDDIIPNRFQPREIFDETGLEELADSIKAHGVIQPIIVRPVGNKFELIAGERRSKASALAGLTTIPAIVRNMDDNESAKISLLENLQRKNLSAIEEARTYKRILELENTTQEELAKSMGKSQPLIANKLRLLSLPEEIQDALIKNQISERHARSLLNIKDKRQQLQLLDKIRKERLTVRELDSIIKNMTTGNYDSMNMESGENSIESNPINNKPNPSIPSPQPTPTNHSNTYNFSNMGLNDYQSSIGNNRFSNLPDYQNLDTGFSNLPETNNINSSVQDAPIDYSEFGEKENANTYFEQPQDENKEIDKPLNTPRPAPVPTSLGSMFDGAPPLPNPEPYSSTDDESKNLFVSNIKENETKPTGNQFLPNFDNMPINSPETQNGTNFMNTPSEMQPTNNFLNMPTNDYPTNFENSTEYDIPNQFNQSQRYLNEPGIIQNDFPVYSDTSYQDNQGSLFNQPLNLVNVPNNEYETGRAPSYSDTQSEDESYQDNFNNPVDNSYENILFAKPVPVNFEDSKQEQIKKSQSDDVEIIGEHQNFSEDTSSNEETTEKNDYINLDPIQTIFNPRQAVLELKKTTDKVKNNNIPIETEEIDFDDYYQIVIKIKKE